ncbi:MAG: hypothetical protein JNK02_09190 [Planctomycetes bacterium]|nr:hypothetical protein [Planctomycetota bacterium]
MPEKDDGFRRLDEASPLTERGRARRSNERLEARAPGDLAPRRVGEILDAGFDALRARFLPCLGACVVLWIGPAWLIAYLPPEEIAQRLAAGEDVLPLVAVAASLGHTLLQSLVQIAGTILVGAIVHGEFEGRPVPLDAALRLVLRRGVPLVITTALVALLAILGLLACVLPYFLVLWRLSLAPLATALEGAGPFQSVRRSVVLTQRSLLRWAAVVVVASCVALPFSGAAGAAAETEVRAQVLSETALSAELYAALLWASATVFFAVATAVAAAATTAFYFDQRVRRDGLDLLTRLAAQRGAELGAAGSRA